MALITEGDFNVYEIPEGQTAPPSNADLSIALALSDGTSVTVFDYKITALGLLTSMRLRNQWLLQLSDDIMAISVSGTKLLLLESSLTNQKLISSFLPLYLHGQTRFAHRNLSQLATMYDALAQSGHCWKTATSVQTNAHLFEANALLIDWFYPTSVMDDATPIRYDFTA